MKNSLKNIKNLSTLFIKDNTYKFDLFKNNKLNKKSSWFWIIVILFFGLSYLSIEVIKYLNKIGHPQIFFNGYFLFIEILIIIQTITLTINIFYFSKELEKILPMPFKPVEILISKFNTLIFFLYGTLILFALIPFSIYGIYVQCNLLFFIKLIILLFIFPIFPALIVSLIIMIFMKTINFIKNKDLLQIVLTFILCFILFFGLYYIINNGQNIEGIYKIELKIENINKYFLNINPIINILEKNNFLNNILNLIYLILINLLAFYIFIFIGKKTYLKQLLKLSFYFKNRKTKKINLDKKCKQNKIYVSYIKNEFKNIIKNPLFFLQCIYPIIVMTFSISLLLVIFIPQVKTIAYEQNLLEGVSFDIEAVAIILGVIQIVGLFNKTTVTAISREGKNAYIMKFLPIDLYKQFVYKNIPQILLNVISSIIILLILFFKIGAIKIQYIILLFIMSILLFCINSYLLLIINLLMPKNNWDMEYEIFKNNKNILIQYVFIIINILFLYYIKEVFYDYNFNKSLIIILSILIIIFIFLNLIINKFKNKLFKRIK